MKILFLILFTVLFAGSCSEKNEIGNLDGKKFLTLVALALSGDQNANQQLSGLSDEPLAISENYSKIKIDSSFIGLKKLYSVVVEYPDLQYNFCAVYDEQFKFYLLDKSLNGHIAIEWMDIGARQMMLVQESFMTSSIVNLKRLSIFAWNGNSMNLVYRSFSRIQNNTETQNQIVTSVSEELLITRIEGSGFTVKADSFYYDQYLNIYTSKNNYFTTFVVNVLNKDSKTTGHNINSGAVEKRKFTHFFYELSHSSEWQKNHGIRLLII